jgi:hypothetical protein
MTNLNQYLISNDQEKVFAVVAIGGFIEALYISFQIAGDYKGDDVFTTYIADQKFVLENICEYSNQYYADGMVNNSLSIIKPIVDIYATLPEIKEKTLISKSAEGKILIKGGNHFTLTEEMYKKLKELTFNARKLITNN